MTSAKTTETIEKLTKLFGRAPSVAEVDDALSAQVEHGFACAHCSRNLPLSARHEFCAAHRGSLCDDCAPCGAGGL